MESNDKRVGSTIESNDKRVGSTIELAPEQENMIRVCTRQYMDDTNNYPRAWSDRKDAVITKYKPVYRLMDKYPEPAMIQRIGNIIVDEWRKYE